MFVIDEEMIKQVHGGVIDGLMYGTTIGAIIGIAISTQHYYTLSTLRIPNINLVLEVVPFVVIPVFFGGMFGMSVEWLHNIHFVK